MNTQEYKGIIEGLLFLSGTQGITIGEIMLTLQVEQAKVDLLIKELKQEYANKGGLELIYTNQTYKLVTKSKYYDYFKTYATLAGNNKLGNSSLETLSIIAYNQPITRGDIEKLKGVAVSNTLQKLIHNDLIYVSGKSDKIGKPSLYSTTGNFLDYVGINSLDELPSLESYKLKEGKEYLLDIDKYDYKELSKELINGDNTVVIESISEELEEELNFIEQLDIDFKIINEEEN